ncbi:MAG TPA: TetR family transcriptional regulator, partial [Caulobacter sp.]|nr:TetR family transcriptional regulator [Caulobacter sp.]
RDSDINMRGLAQELKVSPKLLYRYAASKDELLDLAAAALLETWIAPSDALPWSDRLTAVVGGARDLIERFPALSRAVLMRNLEARDSPEVSRVVASIKGCFADAGLSASEVDQVFLAYEMLILGELALSRAVRDGELSEARLPAAAARAVSIETSLRLMISGITVFHVGQTPCQT